MKEIVCYEISARPALVREKQSIISLAEGLQFGVLLFETFHHWECIIKISKLELCKLDDDVLNL